jgi:GTPase SAR1 family protein
VSDPELVTVTPPDDNSAIFEQLLTDNQTVLLDLIDNLKNHDVSDIIDFPQIIVCGDQSSGKSSVLEAISRVSFPKDESVCTLFPTELALRRGKKRKLRVELRPSTKRSEPEVARFKSWSGYETDNIAEFPDLVNSAKKGFYEAANVDPSTSSFFADTLHVEVTDPQWPPLTVVDLPGIIAAANQGQRDEDVEIPWQLCSQYMSNKKSIILAVISADTQVNVTGIWKLIKQHDPEHKRTICVFTKPDRVQYTENTIPKFVEFSTNKIQGWHFEHGWHIVRNGGPRDYFSSLDDRDKAERKFFSQQKWTKRLNKNQLGVNNLRDRLSKLLERHIRDEMPKLMDEIKDKLAEAKQERDRLGDARPDTKSQRDYLTKLSGRFTSLVEYALNGQYDNDTSFFPEDSEAGDTHLLRASVRRQNQQFYANMRHSGHTNLVIEPPPPNSSPAIKATTWPSFEGLDIYDELKSTEEEPESINREDYLRKIRIISVARMGTEIMGSSNPHLLNIIFKEQAKPWRRLAKLHLAEVCKCIWSHFELVADHIASKDTAYALKHHLLYEFLEDRQSKVEKKLEELLKPYEKGHRVAEDPSYLLNAMRAANARDRERTRAALEMYQQGHKSTNFPLTIPEVDNALYAEKKISTGELFFGNMLTMAQAYYDVCQPTPDSHVLH